MTVLLVALASGCEKSGGASPGAGGDRPPAAQAHEDRPGPARVAGAKPAPNQVTIDNFTFDPPALAVAPGTEVTWVNHDDVPHTATSTAKPRAFDSKTLDTDQKFSHVFTAPGTYEYFCAVHPHMVGRIIVK